MDILKIDNGPEKYVINFSFELPYLSQNNIVLILGKILKVEPSLEEELDRLSEKSYSKRPFTEFPH